MGGRGSLRGDGAWHGGRGVAGGLEQGGWGLGKGSEGLGRGGSPGRTGWMDVYSDALTFVFQTFIGMDGQAEIPPSVTLLILDGLRNAT